ncbi:hypothetical protein FRC09_020464 [Ceratobasidium sp. 395]|nr:hypothetical protein FRC09_020464 [Ceratobasidium sp. 395]
MLHRLPAKKKQKHMSDRPQVISPPLNPQRATHHLQSVTRVEETPVEGNVSMQPAPKSPAREVSVTVSSMARGPLPALDFHQDTAPANPLNQVDDPGLNKSNGERNSDNVPPDNDDYKSSSEKKGEEPEVAARPARAKAIELSPPRKRKASSPSIFASVRTEDNGDDEHEVIEVAACGDFGLKPGSDKSKDLRQRQNAAWTEQLPTLRDAYREFRSKTIPASGSSKEVRSFKVRCVDMDSENTKVFTVDSFAPSALNKVLIHHGYIGCSPLYPKVAVSLSLLKFFSNMVRRDPSVSVPALAKANCDSRNVPYAHNFRTQLGAALDVFNLIERETQRLSGGTPSGDAATQ